MKLKNIQNKNFVARLLIFLSWQVYNNWGVMIPPYKWYRNSLNDLYKKKV